MILYLVPGQLQTPTAESLNTSAVELKWLEVQEGPLMKTYAVSWTALSGENETQTNIENLFYTINNLTSNTQYEFKVTAKNSEGFGSPSTSTSSTTS